MYTTDNNGNEITRTIGVSNTQARLSLIRMFQELSKLFDKFWNVKYPLLKKSANQEHLFWAFLLAKLGMSMQLSATFETNQSQL